MGTCVCEDNYPNNKELKYFFTRKKKQTIVKEEQPDISDILEREKQKKRKIIKKFIIKNLSRLYKKEKFNSLKSKAQNKFFEIEELNFKYEQSFYEEKMNEKITKFIKEKQVIVKDLFSFNLLDLLHKSIPILRDKISIYHNNNIFSEQKEYLNDLITFLKENNLIKRKVTKPNMIKQFLINGILNEENNLNNCDNFLQKKSFNDLKYENNNLKATKDTSNENSKNNDLDNSKIKKDSKVKFKLSWEQITIESLVKIEINNFFDVSLGSAKKNFVECQKKSIFLNILINEYNKKYPQINFPWELRKLIKLLYYIYLLKKYNFLFDTNCFYRINPIEIKKKSIIIDKIILNKRESNFSKNDNTLKIKLLKKVFSENVKAESIYPLESNLIDSMSSILSEEDEKEFYSLISEKNDVKLLKSMTKKEDQNTNNLKLGEEEINDNKSEIDFFNNINANLSNKEKNSFHDIIKKANNLKIFNQIRINKRTKTAKRYKGILFNEYYKGQYDETMYLYAGLGTLVSQNFNKFYHGTFRYGRKEGMGILYEIIDDKNMLYYMGEFHHNRIDGYGIKIIINEKQLIYQEGFFVSQNIVQGKYKKIKQKDNIVITLNYEGEFKDNKFFGQGKLIEKRYIFKEMEKKKEKNYNLFLIKEYEGEFKNGKRNGKGKEIFNKILDNNKNYEYEGDFLNEKKDGYGIINYDNNNFVTRYEGFFENDNSFIKYGIVYFKSGDIYEGFFENSKKDYLGLYLFYDHNAKRIIELYFGGFYDDSKHGIGKTIVDEKENKMFIGPYKRGEKDGQFEKIIFTIESNPIKIKDKRRNAYTSRSLEKKPRLQIKNYPVYEENEIIDTNENYYFNDY